MNRHPRLRARGHLFASALLFGLMATLVRLGSLGAGAFTGPQLALVRMAIGAALTLALFRLRPGTWRPVNHRLLVTRGLLGGGAVLLYFLALTRIPAGEATLLNCTFPVLATVISFWTLEERPTLHLGVALLLATLGMVLVLGNGNLPSALGWGEIFGLASAVVGAGAVTSIRALRATDNPFTIFLFLTLGGMAVSLPFAVAGGAWPAPGPAWLVAGAVGVLSFFAQVLMTDAYGTLTVPEAAVWQQLTPPASYGWALLLLGERLSPPGLVGVLLGVGGVAYGTVLGHRASARPAAAPVDDGARSLLP